MGARYLKPKDLCYLKYWPSSCWLALRPDMVSSSIPDKSSGVSRMWRPLLTRIGGYVLDVHLPLYNLWVPYWPVDRSHLPSPRVHARNQTAKSSIWSTHCG